MARKRSFAAFIDQDGVTVIEYRADNAGLRILGEWQTERRMERIADAMKTIEVVLRDQGARGATVHITLEHFGAVHHMMALPTASDDVLATIIEREVQRLFSLSQPVVAFGRGQLVERREGDRADPLTAPRRVFIAAAPRESIDALRSGAELGGFNVQGVTVVTEAVRRIFTGALRSAEPTAVLLCLNSGPHLSFFVDRQLELAIDPPIALEDDSNFDIDNVVGQLERGALFLRQQFRGAEASELLLAAPASQYSSIAGAIESRVGMRVRPLAADVGTPEAVIALGAVLNDRSPDRVDLFPHAPPLGRRIRAQFRGPHGVMVAAASVALLCGVWLAAQYMTLRATRRAVATTRASLASKLPGLEPLRQVANRREKFADVVAALNGSRAERRQFVEVLRALGNNATPALTFDSLALTRNDKGWSGILVGRVAGSSTGDAMRALDTFYGIARRTPGLSQLDLDQFDYPVPPPDSAPRPTGAALVFRMKLALAPTAAER